MILYTALAELAIRDMARVAGELRHIDPDRLLVVGASRVSSSRYGNLAQCYALRERQEETFSYWYHRSTRRVVKATPWTRRVNTRVTVGDAEMLYLILLRLPRLLGHDPAETLLHELVHIGPEFDGRMRRMRHGKRFDRIVSETLEQWRRHGDPRLVEAMEMPFDALTERWGSLVGRSFGKRFVSTRLCPVENPPPMSAHPDFRTKRVVCDPATVEMVEPDWASADTPAVLTERDLVYRVYTPSSARRISSAAVYCAKNLFPDASMERSDRPRFTPSR